MRSTSIVVRMKITRNGEYVGSTVGCPGDKITTAVGGVLPEYVESAAVFLANEFQNGARSVNLNDGYVVEAI